MSRLPADRRRARARQPARARRRAGGGVSFVRAMDNGHATLSRCIFNLSEFIVDPVTLCHQTIMLFLIPSHNLLIVITDKNQKFLCKPQFPIKISPARVIVILAQELHHSLCDQNRIVQIIIVQPVKPGLYRYKTIGSSNVHNLCFKITIVVLLNSPSLLEHVLNCIEDREQRVALGPVFLQLVVNRQLFVVQTLLEYLFFQPSYRKNCGGNGGNCGRPTAQRADPEPKSIVYTRVVSTQQQADKKPEDPGQHRGGDVARFHPSALNTARLQVGAHI